MDFEHLRREEELLERKSLLEISLGWNYLCLNLGVELLRGLFEVK